MNRTPARATLVTLLLVACGPQAVTPPQGSGQSPAGVNDGIDCLRWTFAADAPRIESVAASFSTRPFPSPDQRARLAAQGLQAAVIRSTDLDQVRRRLGTLTEAYHLPVGQTPTWLQLARRDLGPGERLTASSGFTRRPLEGSVLRLSVRSWLVPDTESGSAQVEAILHVSGPEAQLAAAPGDPPAGTPLLDTRIECRLTDGETLLLLPCPPVPTGKGPATSADLPPTPGVLLLGEPTHAPPEGLGRGHSTAVAISARVPPAMRPAGGPTVDSEAPIADTIPAGDARPQP